MNLLLIRFRWLYIFVVITSLFFVDVHAEKFPNLTWRDKAYGLYEVSYKRVQEKDFVPSEEVQGKISPNKESEVLEIVWALDILGLDSSRNLNVQWQIKSVKKKKYNNSKLILSIDTDSEVEPDLLLEKLFDYLKRFKVRGEINSKGKLLVNTESIERAIREIRHACVEEAVSKSGSVNHVKLSDGEAEFKYFVLKMDAQFKALVREFLSRSPFPVAFSSYADRSFELWKPWVIDEKIPNFGEIISNKNKIDHRVKYWWEDVEAKKAFCKFECDPLDKKQGLFHEIIGVFTKLDAKEFSLKGHFVVDRETGLCEEYQREEILKGDLGFKDVPLSDMNFIPEGFNLSFDSKVNVEYKTVSMKKADITNR